jgi:hypothetical protein
MSEAKPFFIGGFKLEVQQVLVNKKSPRKTDLANQERSMQNRER